MLTLQEKYNKKSVHLEDQSADGLEVSGFEESDAGKALIQSVLIRSVV